ncbi:hypothetical protein FACS189490_10790 [Clostridia bacterium]|nr:hypothetical protein FACS189490_10790 [Clostridia bacterium]
MVGEYRWQKTQTTLVHRQAGRGNANPAKRHAYGLRYRARTDHIQDAAREIVHNPINPRQKARESWSRANSHFQEVKHNLPKERRRVADEAQKTARTANNTAAKLQKTAEQAKETATEAKTAVKDAKQTLKQVRQSGRLKIREAKIKTKAEYTRATDYGGGVRPDLTAPSSPLNATSTRATPNDTTKPAHRPFNRPADIAPRDIGNAPGKPPNRPANAKPLSANQAGAKYRHRKPVKSRAAYQKSRKPYRPPKRIYPPIFQKPRPSAVFFVLAIRAAI